MAFLFADGMDWLAAAADITMRWDTASGSGNAIVAAANTAFGVGQAFQFPASGSNTLAKAWGSNDATIFGTIRRKQAGGTSGVAYFMVQFVETASIQCTIRWNEDTSITVASGAAGGTVIGSVAAGAFSVNSWDSWQFKVVIHNTAGSVEIRKNGSATPILSVTNVNTRAGSANAYANKIQVGESAASTTTHQFDDFLLCSSTGAAPNDWTGDLRGYTEAPSGTAQSQWANTGGASSLVSVQTNDGDTSYIASSTVAQEDLYTFPTLASASISPVTIAGVVPFAICKRSDSGARTVSVRCKSGATDTAVLTDAAVPLTYAFRGTMQATDPNTGAAWTTAGVNGMSAGVKIDA